MASPSLKLTVIAAALLLPVTAAQAQYYGAASPPPLFPYGVQTNQPYAVQVAPNTYVIKRPAPAPVRNYPYVRSQSSGRGIINTVATPAPGRFDRQPKPVDHALVEELRNRHQNKGAAGNSTTKIVREAPVVRETKRYVDDPPRIIERRHVVDDEAGTVETTDQPVSQGGNHGANQGDGKRRVIQADAEVTILGPDRMSIRLFRKGQGPKANARAN